jgi:hypothetical protein
VWGTPDSTEGNIYRETIPVVEQMKLLLLLQYVSRET